MGCARVLTENVSDFVIEYSYFSEGGCAKISLVIVLSMMEANDCVSEDT
ncbi:hypothetical protein HMPREF0044_0214 [Gleimia coleocanis DSM 15436]|uniref:Uncharacterized protein n=1 Tax=Gleimia coleocanis DSM 15436 TaxID=525245 RepID=C0VYH4_9ACTO|nr:hypothetical protein HMPREF0044_0214 [Gleimia coleocanis DSM 15436]